MALSLGGPHAFLTFASVAVALGEEPAAGPDELISDGTGRAVLDLMATVDALAPAETRTLNPIGLLELMSRSDRLAHCPLVYGYVTYADRLAFTDAPVARPGDGRAPPSAAPDSPSAPAAHPLPNCWTTSGG